MVYSYTNSWWGIFFLFAGAHLSVAQPQTVLLLDNFESYPLNSFEEETSTFQQNADITRQTLKDYEAFCHSGKSLRITYDVSQDTSFCGAVSFLPLTDLTNYNYLSFWMRGTKGNEYMIVEIETLNGDTAKVAVANYLSCGPTTDWQKVVIPLDAFWNLKIKTNVVKLTIVFDHYTSFNNNSPLSSEVHLDDFLFGTYFSGYVKIDPFEDKINSNATGGNNGDFSPSGIAGIYWSETICNHPPLNNCNCKLRLIYDNGQGDDFGGAFFILGGYYNGWIPVGKNIGRYDSLYLEAKAPSSALNPGNFKVELKSDAETSAYQILGINLSNKAFSIPFAAFDPPVNPDNINQFTIVFEKNIQEVLAGEVLVDNIELRAEGFNFPDLINPQSPTFLALNGSPLQPENLLPINTSFTISAVIENDKPRLESVRLEYKIGCEWICLKKLYSPFNVPQVNFTVQPGDLPVSTWVDMRIVAENYTGYHQESPPFQIKIGENTPPSTPEEILFNAFEVFQFLRYGNGVYTDAARFMDPQFHPASVATTGMGLISLCIADAMGWIDNAEDLVLETLISMNGLRPGFVPERNSCGWFRHFIDQNTGEQAWNSEFSSIDSGILTAGALSCKNYFSSNDSIICLANKLYLSTDWESMIANPATGGVYLTADSLCAGNGITLPFNEYMIVAWLAKNDYRQTGNAELLWNQHYADPNVLPKTSYLGVETLTDNPGHFLPSFVPQFAYYLCHYYTTQSDYLQYFKNAMRVDSAWWANNVNCNVHIWGFGAGAANDWVPSGYNADNCEYHPGTICSPHIIGGFIPTKKDALNDILWLDNTPLGKYYLPDSTPVLWRFSTENPAWRAGDVQGIDFSSMLLGIAAHPDILGQMFFENLNDFVFPDSTDCKLFPVSVKEESISMMTKQNFPNPFAYSTTIPFSISKIETYRLDIFNVHGQLVFEKEIYFPQTGDFFLEWNGEGVNGRHVSKGIYFYSLRSESGVTSTRKMILINK